jgi:aspartate aminotransferase-like enzyme
MKIDTTLEILALFTILTIVGSTLTYIMVLNAYGDNEIDEEFYSMKVETKEDINKVIKEGLEECYMLDNEACLGVMHSLDNICQIAYYEACFNEKWAPFMKHLEVLINNGHYEDEKYKDDPYLTLNNHHYGNSEI